MVAIIRLPSLDADGWRPIYKYLRLVTISYDETKT
jgi:hypothetical protein